MSVLKLEYSTIFILSFKLFHLFLKLLHNTKQSQYNQVNEIKHMANYNYSKVEIAVSASSQEAKSTVVVSYTSYFLTMYVQSDLRALC